MKTIRAASLSRLILSCVVAAVKPAAAATYYRNGPPRIVTQPVGGTFEQGQTIQLKITPESFSSNTADYHTSGYASGSDYEPHYQWMKNNERITGATSATFTLGNAQPSDSGAYAVIVSNKFGWVSSTTATITVIATYLPTITKQPVGATRFEGETASFEVFAAGVPAPTLRWRKNGVTLPGATLSRLVLSNLQSADAGSYDALVTNSRGTVMSLAAGLTVLAPPAASAIATTTITAPPQSIDVSAGSALRLAVAASGEHLMYQWKKDGVPLVGATSATLDLGRATAGDMGFYSVVVRGDDGTVESDAAIVTVAAGGASRLANLSTRAFVPAGGALTPGFTLRGTNPAALLVRAVGPTLSRFGVASALANPRFELIPAGATAPVLANDDWATAPGGTAIISATAAVGAFALEANSEDAAGMATLDASPSSNYTVRITSANPNASGVVLAEIYDASSSAEAGRLAAVSALAFTRRGDGALVAGFTIEGDAPKTLLVRAIGPSLASFGVAGVIAEPQVTVSAARLNRVVAHTTQGWRGDEALRAAFARTGAFPLADNSRDAALLVTFPPGSYTVQVGDAAEGEGMALLEIYEVPSTRD